MIDVYFDGKCGLCSKEIRYYQTIAPAGVFAWHDIARDPAPLAALGVAQETALRRLHVTDENKTLHQGVDGFIVIWQKLRYWYLLSLLVRLPLIHKIAEIAYNLFADYRFKKLDHCQIFLEK